MLTIAVIVGSLGSLFLDVSGLGGLRIIVSSSSLVELTWSGVDGVDPWS